MDQAGTAGAGEAPVTRRRTHADRHLLLPLIFTTRCGVIGHYLTSILVLDISLTPYAYIFYFMALKHSS